MLEGKRVILRPIKKEDIELHLKWFNDQEVTQNLLFIFPLTREKEEKWITETNLSENSVVFAIEVRGENRKPNFPIGNCGIHSINWVDRDAKIGIAIGEKNYQGMGYGTEAISLLINYAFENLNLNRISSSVISFNEKSLKLHKKLGFRREGIKKKARFKKGRYHDEILFGLLKSKWEKKNK